MAKDVAPTGMELIPVILTTDKDTKNARRFVAKPTVGQPPLLESVYLPLWRVGDLKTIRVFVELPKAA